MILRKGAIAAHKGEKVLIPINKMCIRDRANTPLSLHVICLPIPHQFMWAKGIFHE